MHCDQIKRYLNDYADGVLPPFKRSWVAQHLAGCDRCRALAVAAKRSRRGACTLTAQPGKVAAAADSLLPAGGSASVAVQRPVPPRVRRRLALFAAVLLLGITWLLRDRTGSRQPTLLRFNSAAQSHGGVSLSLKSLVAHGEQLQATFRFDGLAIAPIADSWVTVRTPDGERLPALPPVLTPDTGGVTVQVAFRLPEAHSGFRVTLAGVNQQASASWALPLPAPPEGLEQLKASLPGAPIGVALHRYGLVKGVLQVELSLSERLRGDIPKLSLRDGYGVLFAPAAIEGPLSSGELMLHFAVPKSLRLPLRLVGDASVQNYLGPWTIEANMVR